MKAVRVFELLGNKVLVTRQSARSIAPALERALVEGEGEIELDFSEVQGIAPSFLDELLGVLQESLAPPSGHQLKLRLVNPPTRLSSKFEAVGRGRGLLIRESDDDAWLVSDGEGPEAGVA